MASSFVNSVYELASNTNSPALLAKALTLRAEFHLLQGDIGSAAKDVDEAQSLIDEDFDLETIDIRRLLGLLAVHLGLAPEARDHFESALAKVSDFCDKFRSFTA